MRKYNPNINRILVVSFPNLSDRIVLFEERAKRDVPIRIVKHFVELMRDALAMCGTVRRRGRGGGVSGVGVDDLLMRLKSGECICYQKRA